MSDAEAAAMMGFAQSMWTTPKASDVDRGDCPSERRRRTPFLPSQVKNWPTPTREDGESARRGKNAQGGASLTEIAAPRPWPTPTTKDAIGARNATARRLTDAPFNPGRTLVDEVILDGEAPREVVNAAEAMGGALNPDWVEQLMGFPAGWTRTDGPRDPASPSAPTKRRASRPRKRTAARG